MSDHYTDADLFAACVAADHASADIAAPTAAQLRAALDAVAPAIAARALREAADMVDDAARQELGMGAAERAILRRAAEIERA